MAYQKGDYKKWMEEGTPLGELAEPSKAEIKQAFREGVQGKTKALPVPYNKKAGDKKEAAIQKEIIQELKALNVFWKRFSLGAKIIHTGDSAMGVQNELKGHPDLMVIANGFYVPIEVKRPGERLSTAQWAIMLDMQRHGAFPLVGVSADVVEAVRVAKERPEEFPERYRRLCEKLNYQFPVL